MGKLSCQYNSLNSEDYALIITYEKKTNKKTNSYMDKNQQRMAEIIRSEFSL